MCLGIRFTVFFRISEGCVRATPGFHKHNKDKNAARLTENVMSNSDQKFNTKETAQRRDKELTQQADKNLIFPNNNISQLKNS
jgi:hypothetical protein